MACNAPRVLFYAMKTGMSSVCQYLRHPFQENMACNNTRVLFFAMKLGMSGVPFQFQYHSVFYAAFIAYNYDSANCKICGILRRAVVVIKNKKKPLCRRAVVVRFFSAVPGVTFRFALIEK